MKVINVVGARPNFMKMAPLMEQFHAHPEVTALLVHTGQHYDNGLSGVFFRELGMPKPDINLEVGSASHAVQTAEIMKAFEPVLIEHEPDRVVVVGDVNSTIACALVAVKLGVKVAHVEAGLRSRDRSMPEEINRVLTDAISHDLFVTERDGIDNLHQEGIPDQRIHFVGNVMIDTLLKHREKAKASQILDQLGLQRKGFALLTMHRPSNVDDPATLKRLVDVVRKVAQRLPVIWPVHPRARSRLDAAGLWTTVEQTVGIRTSGTVGYLDFLALMDATAVMLTDSGGVQEETTVLGVPCVTMRENTERPVTISQGTNVLVGTDPQAILEAVDRALAGPAGPRRIPELWDGHAAERIVQILTQAHASGKET